MNEQDAVDIADPMGQVAKDVFGVQYLYPYQRLVIADILDSASGQSTEKVAGRVVLLPTGAGKSLCFMVPAMLLPGPTLVIYPLLALMSDQERRLKEAKVDCVILRGGQTAEERDAAYKRIEAGAHIIITNPEMVQQEDVIRHLSECGISHIAIDEAHCITEWGDSFRPSYLALGKVIKMLASPVVTAFTATASADVLHRIAEILFGDEWANVSVIRSDADRQNLHYFVVKSCNKEQAALLLSRTEARPMLIFCGTRRRAEHMARLIYVLSGYDAVRFYHAGLEREERKEIEEWFMETDSGILVATCAYGMGVDKKNIRTVIHLDAPPTAEAYLQEAGRGGRDGGNMNAILLWSPSDYERFSAFPASSRECIMMRYAAAHDCRRRVLLSAISDPNASETVCSGCDNCGMRLRVTPAWDGGKALRLIANNRLRYTMIEAEQHLKEKMNIITQNIIGVRTWNHAEAKTVMEELSKAKAIKESGGLWKGKVTVTGEWKTLLKEQGQGGVHPVGSGDNRS